MDRPEYPQHDQPGAGEEPAAASNVPALIHDYRAQRAVWREQARNLARMREEVLAAADHEARDIVQAARTDIRRILLKARRDLIVLAAQVRAAGRIGDADETPDAVAFLPTDDLAQAQEVFTSARHDMRRVLDESRPELEGLAAEGEALRSALRPQQSVSPRPVRRISSDGTVEADANAGADSKVSPYTTDVDFEFTSIGLDDSPDLTLRHRRPSVRLIVAAVATIVGIAAMGTVWWLSGSEAKKAAPPTAAPRATTSPSAAAPKSVGEIIAERRATAPDPKFPLSIDLATRANSWVRITADGRTIAERVFKPSERQHIAAAREISIRAGDAGAVTVAVDGRPPVALGDQGETVTRRFLVDARRASPPASSTSAPSPQVTSPQPTTPRPAAPLAPPQRSGLTAAPVSAPPSVGNSPPARGAEQPATAPPAPNALAAAPPAASSAPPAALPAASTPSPVERPAATPPATAERSLQDSLANDAARWLDAYYRQDRATMASISPKVTIADQRDEKERLPRGLPAVQRSFDGLQFRVLGPVAMLTAKMTERSDSATGGRMSVSYISHIWTQRNGGWEMDEVRIASASSIGQTLRR